MFKLGYGMVWEDRNPLNMKIEDFNKLPLDERTNYLWDHGICTSQRLIRNEYIVCIFELEHFFVEARYSTNDNRVDDVQPISELNLWESYVDLELRAIFSLS